MLTVQPAIMDSEERVRVKIIIKGQAGDQTRSFEFPAMHRMDECTKMVRDKLKEGDSNIQWGDHLLFWGEKRMFFQPHRTMAYYDIRSNTELMFRKRHRAIQITFMNESMKKFMIDETEEVKDIIHSISEDMGLGCPEQLGLLAKRSEKSRAKTNDYKEYLANVAEQKADKQADKKSQLLKKQITMFHEMDQNWLDPSRPLLFQHVYDSETIILKFRFFNKLNLSPRKEPARLNLLYFQGVQQVITGSAVMSESETIRMASYILQVTCGDREPKHTKDYLDEINLKVCSPKYKLKKMWGKIDKAHNAMIGVSKSTAMYRFVVQWARLKSFGAELYTCLIPHLRRRGVIAFRSREIMLMIPNTKLPPKRYLMADMKKWLHDEENDSFQIVMPEDMVRIKSKFVRQMTDAVAGNISLVMLQMHSEDNTDEANEKSDDEEGGTTADEYWSNLATNPYDADLDDFEAKVIADGVDGDALDMAALDDLDDLAESLADLDNF